MNELNVLMRIFGALKVKNFGWPGRRNKDLSFGSLFWDSSSKGTYNIDARKKKKLRLERKNALKKGVRIIKSITGGRKLASIEYRKLKSNTES